MPGLLHKWSYRAVAFYAATAVIAFALPVSRGFIRANVPLVVFLFAVVLVVAATAGAPEGELGLEEVPADESPTIVAIKAMRLAHPSLEGRKKSSMCVCATFTVNEQFRIPEAYRATLGDVSDVDLRVGLFAERGRTYDAMVEFADSADRFISGPTEGRSVGIKLFGVPGAKFRGDDNATFEFVLFGHEAELVATPADFLSFLAVRARFGSGTIGLLAQAARRPRGAFNALGARRRIANPLAAPWFSATPYLLGRWADEPRFVPRVRGRPRAVKYRLALEATPADMAPVLGAGARFDFSIQLQTSAHRQPIENAAVAWSAADSPWISVAKIEVAAPAGGFDLDDFGERLACNPWRCFAEHRPLGGLNRARWEVPPAPREGAQVFDRDDSRMNHVQA